MPKIPKVKGYGAYWKGDIKNKTIARKNKQYISDQRCLKVYKKHLKTQTEQLLDTSDGINGDGKGINGAEPLSITSDHTEEYSVKTIKPQVETVYYISESEKTRGSNNKYHNDTDEAGIQTLDGAQDDSSDIGTDEEDASDHSELADSQRYDNNKGSHVDKQQLNTADRRAYTPGTGEATEVKPDKRTRKGIAKTERGRGGVEETHQRGGKVAGVYAKALKIRHERSKARQQQHDEKLNKIKQKKREIREKKQQRYARHRMLGNKTKKGQPIMANVISHLMKNFQKKHKLDE